MSTNDSNDVKTKIGLEAFIQTGKSLLDPNTYENDQAQLNDYLKLDSFDEDEIEQRFLTSKPTCFLVIGKPGSGKTTIAERLAEEWKCEFINPTHIIKQNIKELTDLGKKAQDILLKGEAVPEEMVAKMINDKVNSQEVQHHGYVLEGFPSQSENNFDITKQMEMLKNWKLQPDFIINLRISDPDLTKRRVYQKVDPVTGSLYIREIYAPIKPKAKEIKEEEEESEENEEEEHVEEEEKPPEVKDEFFNPIESEIIERLVVRPEDTKPMVEDSIKSFKQALLDVLEDQMANMDQSYLIELDSNTSPTFLIKQLLQRLQSYIISKAARPLRINEPIEGGLAEEEEGISLTYGAPDNYVDPSEVEEAFNGLLSKKRLSSKYKWRRSKGSFYCPVSLKDGRIVMGKADYAAAFLDKIYMMADEASLKAFLKNPRPYLRLPQPRAPCKLSILGVPYAGKTTLSSVLAKKYNAKVIDMKTLMEPELKKSKDALIESTKNETIQVTMEQIKLKYREKLENERAQREIEEAEKAAAAAEANQEEAPPTETIQEDNEEVKSEAGEKTADQPAENIETERTASPKLKVEQDQQIQKESTTSIDEMSKFITVNEENEIIVSQDHPEIESAVKQSLEEISRAPIELPASEYIRVLQEELEQLRKERFKLDPIAANDGGWILDNFPNNQDQLNAMVANNIVPDTFIVLQDSTYELNILCKRWYNLNRQEIDEQIQKRWDAEELKRLEELKEAEEQKKKQKIEIEISEDGEQSKQAPTETSSSPTASMSAIDDSTGETASVDDEEAQKRATVDPLEKIVEEDESKDKTKEDKTATASTINAASTKQDSTDLTFKTAAEPGTPTLKQLPERGPEIIEFINSIRVKTELLGKIQSTISSVTGNDAFIIDINDSTSGESKSAEACCNEAATTMEKMFKFNAVDFEGVEEEEQDEGEEEENLEEEEEDGGEEGEEEEEDEDSFDPSLKDKKIQFGETSYFCPVSLHTRGILVPGNQDIQCKYREKVYRFTSDESRQGFMENPTLYLPNMRKKLNIPPPRILILGPRGSGKSVQARALANKLDIFHIKFRDYLQELIIGKTKKYVEPEREEDKDAEEENQQDDDDDDINVDGSNKSTVKEVAPPPELTDKEDNIKSYLEKDEALPNDILDFVLTQFWTEEPFKSRGFVLDGFPNNESQAQYLIEKGLFPDAIIILRLDDEQIIQRLLPPRLEQYRARVKAKKEKKRLKAERKKEKLNKRMQERRNEEIAKYQERRKEKEEMAAATGEEAEEEEFDIEALIQEEFADELQQEEETVEEMQEDEVRENMINDIRMQFETQTNTAEAVKEILQEVHIPRFTIDAKRKENIVRYLINKKLERFIDHRQSLLERVYPVKLGLAQRLLDFGYKKLSRFGRWCPVQLTKNDPIQPLYDQKKRPFPVIHRSFIYFLSSKQARAKFMQDPIHYLNQKSPLTVVPFRLSIVGPPKSGKTYLANRFAKDFGCVRLSAGEAIRSLLEKQPDTDLAHSINSFLIKGKSVPDELTIKCIEVAIMDVKCQLRGYILDNFPVTKQQVKIMTDHNLIPVKVIELRCDIKEIMQRCIRDRTSAERLAKGLILNDSPEIMGYKLREWKNEINFIHDWYENEHKNLVQLDGNKSKWAIWEDCKKIGFESVQNVQIYLNRVNNQQAASISKLCVTYDEMVNRLGDFGQYCPVSLALKGELVDCSDTKSMDFVAEYQSYYYKMHSAKELELFLADPKQFVPPNAPRKLPVPTQLPRKLKKEEVKELFPKPVELNGYCPVTFYDGKLRYEAIEKGFEDFAVEYRNKIYFMINDEALNKFMRKPEQYANLKLPHKLPPVKSPLNVFSLPMTGYLEQTVAELLKKALNEVGDFKPKFPFLSPTRSALLYVAYYLKAYNPKSSEYRRKKYKQKLVYFEQKCNLIDFLFNQATIKYKDPAKRTTEYNDKLESFFALQDNVPTMNWLA